MLIVPKSVTSLFGTKYTYQDLDLTNYISQQIHNVDIQIETHREYDRIFELVVIVVLTISCFGFTYLKLFRTNDVETLSVGKLIALMSGAMSLVAKVHKVVLGFVLKIIVNAKRREVETQWRESGIEL
jgi:hypothetical protein